MEHLKKCWYARPLSLCLSLVIAVTSLLLTLSMSAPAKAQAVTRAPVWAVLDFNNQTSYGGADVGREASDALVLELGRTNRFNLLTRSQIQQGMDAIGITPPLDSTDIQKLGGQLNADAVVDGDVLSIAKNNNGNQAEVAVAVRVVDSSTGELINGALAEGLSTPRNGPAPDFDTLVNEAISKAAFAAVKQVVSYNLPEPTVLNNQGQNTVLLNAGSRDGVQSGMNFLVRRDGVEVGRLQVTSVEADESTANVTQTTLGIRPGDRARAIYSLPPYSIRGGRVVTDTTNIATSSATSAPKRNAFAGVGGVILAILAAALLVALVNRGSKTANVGGGNIGGVTAQAAYYPATPGLEYTPTLAYNASTFQPNTYGVYLTWTTGNLNPTSIVAFNIYRAGFTTFSQFEGSSPSSSSSTTSTGGLIYDFNVGPVLTEAKTQRTAIDYGGGRLGITFPYVTYPISGGSTSTSGTTTTTTTSTSTSGTSTTVGVPIGSISTETVTGTEEDDIPQITIGTPTNYSVTAIYQITEFGAGTTGTTTSGGTGGGTSTSTSGSGTGTIGYEETPITTSVSGTVTPILPIDVENTGAGGVSVNLVQINNISAYNATNVNLTSVSFSFTTNLGADTYVVDVATNPNFSNKVTLGPNPLSSSRYGGQTLTTTAINLKQVFPGTTASTPIYYRIGDRFSGDSPGPYRNDTLNPNPDLFGQSNATYVYSAVGQFYGT